MSGSNVGLPWGERVPGTPPDRPRLFQMLVEEIADVAPQFLRRSLPIARAVVGEEGMAGVLVHLGHHILAGGLGALFQLGFERDRRVLVFGAEHAEQRAV